MSWRGDLFAHRRRQSAIPHRPVLLERAPADWMILEYDTRTHDPYNSAPGFRPAQGACEFTREGRSWLGDRLPGVTS